MISRDPKKPELSLSLLSFHNHSLHTYTHLRCLSLSDLSHLSWFCLFLSDLQTLQIILVASIALGKSLRIDWISFFWCILSRNYGVGYPVVPHSRSIGLFTTSQSNSLLLPTFKHCYSSRSVLHFLNLCSSLLEYILTFSYAQTINNKKFSISLSQLWSKRIVRE